MKTKMYKLDCWENKVIIGPNKVFGAVKIMLPARFDFIGGWTDTPPYYFDNDASVLNSTLTLGRDDNEHDINKGIKIEIYPAKEFTVIENGKVIRDLNENLIIKKIQELLDINNPKLSISISNCIPKGSGLGGSSLLATAILAGLWGYFKGINYIGEHLNELVNNVLLIEQLMKSGGGWQDQIGGILPGIKLIETTPEEKCNYSISYLENSSQALNNTSLIIDTRIQRKASNILYSIRQKYVDRNPKTIKVLKTIAANARLGFILLEEGKLVHFAELLSESWQMVNEIENGSVECSESIKRICGKDLIGLKIGGAGGGGFVLAIFRDAEKKEFYKKIIEKHFPDCFIYNPVFGGPGLSVYQEDRINNKNMKYYQIDKIKWLESCEKIKIVTV